MRRAALPPILLWIESSESAVAGGSLDPCQDPVGSEVESDPRLGTN